MVIMGAILSAPLIVGIGFVLMTGAFIVLAARQTKSRWEEAGDQNLSNEARTLLRPLRRHRDDLHEFVKSNQNSPSIKVLGTEAAQEADHIVKQSIRLLTLRDQVKDLLRGQGEAQIELARIDASDPAFASARQAREAEISHYEKMALTLPRLDAEIAQANAALSEIKARLALSASQDHLNGDQQLSETVARLKAIGASFDEAEAMLQETVR